MVFSRAGVNLSDYLKLANVPSDSAQLTCLLSNQPCPTLECRLFSCSIQDIGTDNGEHDDDRESRNNMVGVLQADGGVAVAQHLESVHTSLRLSTVL